MPSVPELYQRLASRPGGKAAFSALFCLKAPYFATIAPVFRELRPNYAELFIRKHRGVSNHIGTMHVIAIVNGLEAAMGALAEVSVPADRRWIPVGMEVTYPALATSGVRCVAETDAADWLGGRQDLPVRVRALRDDDVVVVEGVIRLRVTRRKGHGRALREA